MPSKFELERMILDLKNEVRSLSHYIDNQADKFGALLEHLGLETVPGPSYRVTKK